MYQYRYQYLHLYLYLHLYSFKVPFVDPEQSLVMTRRIDTAKGQDGEPPHAA
jgi:hypothetical protein